MKGKLYLFEKIAIDAVLVNLAFFGVFWLRFQSGLLPGEKLPVSPSNYLVPAAVVTGFWLFLFTLFGLYRKRGASVYNQIIALAGTITFGVFILVLLTFDLSDPFPRTRMVIFSYWLLLIGFLGSWRFMIAYKGERGKGGARANNLTIKRLGVLGGDLVIFAICYYSAFLLRFGGRIPSNDFSTFLNTLPLVLIIRFGAFYYFGLYRGIWKYAGINELISILKATLASSLVIMAPIYFLRVAGYPRSVFVIDWALVVLLTGGMRFALRAVRETPPLSKSSGKRLLIVGAGDAGDMLLREIKKNKGLDYNPVGFVDDDLNKAGVKIHGVPVLGRCEDIPELINSRGVEEIIIAIPSATGAQMRRIFGYCRRSRAKFLTIPPLKEIIGGEVHFNQVREVRMEDLLGREPVDLDMELIRKYLEGKAVLITGAGGSIGSELCRQVAGFHPAKLILLDRAENSLFYIEMELREKFPDLYLCPLICDINNGEKLKRIMNNLNPQVIFHSAAYKHVPLMEDHPEEAVLNNILGTKRIVLIAHQAKVEKFVMISTDKAVRPSSVMGATKRIAELYVQGFSKQSQTQFVTVRFGNVLGSQGSVVPIFQHQIARGGPITVTHPEVTRYFMTLSEAAQLVMQAGALGRGGDILLLDMGEPLKIVDLARDMISLSGLDPDEDVQIKFCGLRKGEKLHEELFVEGEGVQPTSHEKILVAQPVYYDWEKLESDVQGLEELAHQVKREEIIKKLKEMIPAYKPTVNFTREKDA